MPKEAYGRAFDRVKAAIEHGDSFLLNLTFPTKIELNCGLEDIFYQAKAPYKLFKEDAFVVFSPESFVKSTTIKSILSQRCERYGEVVGVVNQPVCLLYQEVVITADTTGYL